MELGMERKQHDEVPVLIVGAGPAGLTAAATLARHGVECLLVERRETSSSLPRATVLSLRTMELIRAWRLEDEVRAGGVEVEWLLWQCETLASFSDGAAVFVGLPTREQSALVSPTSPACVPQDHLEPVLLSHLRSLGSTRIAQGTQLVGLASLPDGVRATLHHARSGETRVVQARYLVAADGAYSLVRRALGIDMCGPERIFEGITTQFRAPLWDVLRDCRYGIYGVNRPDASRIFLPAGPEDRWRYGFIRDPDGPHVAEYSGDRLAAEIRAGAGVADLPLELEQIASFTAGAQVADRFRHENVFLVGDAAHRVTPRGGTGMNTAVHDGYDLAWKLGWVLRGWARPGLLDTYEAERRPVAEHNAARSADPKGSVRAAEQELRVDLGGRLPHVWVSSSPERLSTLDLVGSGLTLFTGPAGGPWQSAAGALREGVPVAVHDLDEISARAIGIRGDGALLVRPDATLAAWWSQARDAGRLGEAVRTSISGTVPELPEQAPPSLERAVA